MLKPMDDDDKRRIAHSPALGNLSKSFGGQKKTSIKKKAEKRQLDKLQHEMIDLNPVTKKLKLDRSQSNTPEPHSHRSEKGGKERDRDIDRERSKDQARKKTKRHKEWKREKEREKEKERERERERFEELKRKEREKEKESSKSENSDDSDDDKGFSLSPGLSCNIYKQSDVSLTNQSVESQDRHNLHHEGKNIELGDRQIGEPEKPGEQPSTCAAEDVEDDVSADYIPEESDKESGDDEGKNIELGDRQTGEPEKPGEQPSTCAAEDVEVDVAADSISEESENESRDDEKNATDNTEPGTSQSDKYGEPAPMADHGEHPPAKRDSTNNKDKQKPLAHQGESSLKSFIQRELFLRDNGYEDLPCITSAKWMGLEVIRESIKMDPILVAVKHYTERKGTDDKKLPVVLLHTFGESREELDLCGEERPGENADGKSEFRTYLMGTCQAFRLTEKNATIPKEVKELRGNRIHQAKFGMDAKDPNHVTLRSSKVTPGPFLAILKEDVKTGKKGVVCLGDNKCYQLGLGDQSEHFSEVLSDEDVVDIDVGFGHCLALCKNNKVYSWGLNKRGQCSGDTKYVFGPTLIEYNQEDDVDGIGKISCGGDFSALVTTGKDVLVLGDNRRNRLGTSEECPRIRTPTKVAVEDQENFKIKEVACAASLKAVLCEDGNVYVWIRDYPGLIKKNRQDIDESPVESLVTNSIDEPDMVVQTSDGRVRGKKRQRGKGKWQVKEVHHAQDVFASNDSPETYGAVIVDDHSDQKYKRWMQDVFSGFTRDEIKQFRSNKHSQEMLGQILDYLISVSECEKVMGARDDEGGTLFHVVARGPFPLHPAKKCGEKINDVAQSDKIRTILKNIIKALIRHGVDISLRNQDGHTALDIALLNGKREIASDLITCNSAERDDTMKGYQELKALNAGHIAAKKGNTRILKMMKELGIRLDIEDNEKHYPIYYAIKYEQRDAFDFLINYGFPSVTELMECVMIANEEWIKGIRAWAEKAQMHLQPQQRRTLEDAGIPTIEIDIKPVDPAEARRLIDNEECYPLKSKPRGRAIIVNIEEFEGSKEKRTGSNVDACNLRKLYEELDFKVELWENLKREELMIKAKKEAKHSDHQKADAFIFTMLSHGNRGKISCTDSQYVRLEELYAIFDAKDCNCPSLKGKPKIFIIQACQGSRETDGVPSGTEADGPGDSERVHERKDFFIASSVVEGYKSYRNLNTGSYFIRALIYTFMECCHVYSMGDIMKQVNKKLDAKDIEFRERRTKHSRKQIAEARFTTTKSIYFLPKYYRESS